MISDGGLATLCAATYTAAAPSLAEPSSGVFACITEAPDGIVVAFRGSITAEDWARDFLTLAVDARNHPQLGYCHDGFLTAAESIIGEVLSRTGDKPTILTGHSLGGAEAVGVGALMTLAGKPPIKICTFGAPRFGMDKFVDVLNVVKVLPQYRRGNDLVPELPLDLPPLLQFLDSRAPLIQVGKPQFDALACHHVGGYVTDVTAYLATETVHA